MSSSAAPSDHIDLNATAAPPPQKRGRGRPRKVPPAPPPPPVPPQPEPAAAAARVQDGEKGRFAPGDMVWGKVRNHPWWPGQVISTGGGSQLLVSYFGDKAFAWCDAAELKPFADFFPTGERYDSGGEEFAAALDASLDEISRRVQAALACGCVDVRDVAVGNAGIREGTRVHPGDYSANIQSFVPGNFVHFVQDLAADPGGFTDRLQLAVGKAQLKAFDRFRGFPDPPEFYANSGLENGEVFIAPVVDVFGKGASEGGPSNYISMMPSKRGRKRKEDLEEDSDEDWEPRKRGMTDSDSDMDLGWKKGSNSKRRGSSTPRGRPRGRPRKRGVGRVARLEKDIEMEMEEDMEAEAEVEYLSATEMLAQLALVAADPIKGYDSVALIVSFFSKYKGSVVPSAYDDKELLETLGGKKGRRKSMGALYSATKTEDYNDKELEMVGGERGRRKSAGSLYSARKAEDSYWCDIIVGGFNDGDASSDYDGRKRKRGSHSRRGSNKKMKQEVTPLYGSSADPPIPSPDVDNRLEAKPVDGPTTLVLHFSSAEAIPSEGEINNIFCVYGPIREGETVITKKTRTAKVVFSKRADAERAYSSAGKYNTFGPALLSYDLSYSTPPPQIP